MSKRTGRYMIDFDSAYTYRIMEERNIFVIVTARDLAGYFDHIWTVHPVAGLLYQEAERRYGKATIHQINERHSFVEGKIGRYKSLRWFAPLNFLLAQLQLVFLLRKISRQHKIDFVRSEDPHYNGLLGLLFSWLLRKPLLVGVWGNPGAVRKYTGKPLMPRLFKKVWVEATVEKFVLRRADCVMIQNKDNQQFVISSGVPEKKTAFFRVGNLIHADHFLPPSQRKGGKDLLASLGVSDEKVLMCISRLEALKLTDHVIKAAAILKAKGWRLKVLFVGDGSFRNQMQEQASSLGLSNEVVFCGNRSQDWLAKTIPAVNVVVSPLTGRALTEAALGGAPIAAYNIDWHGEVIITGETGELVPYLDFESLARATERLLADEGYARQMGDNARALMMQLMDPEANNRQQVETYEHLKHPHLRAIVTPSKVKMDESATSDR